MFDIIKQMLYLTTLQQFNWAIIIVKSFFEDKKLVIISSKTIRLNSLIEINKSIRHEIKSIISRNESLAEYEKKKKNFFFFLSIRVFFHRQWQLTGQQGKGGDLFLFHFTTSTCSQTFRHLRATLQLRWLSHIFNHNACIYQTATRRDIPPYRITIWLIDDVMLI